MNISELSSGIPIFVIGEIGFKVFKDQKPSKKL